MNDNDPQPYPAIVRALLIIGLATAAWALIIIAIKGAIS